MTHDELDKFTGSLTYSIWRFYFYPMAQRGWRWHNAPIYTLVCTVVHTQSNANENEKVEIYEILKSSSLNSFSGTINISIKPHFQALASK